MRSDRELTSFRSCGAYDFCTNLPSFRAKLGGCFAVTFGSETGWSFERIVVQKSKVGVRALEFMKRPEVSRTAFWVYEAQRDQLDHLLYILHLIYICIKCPSILHASTLSGGD
jgi:hypothetical protein